MRTDIRKEVKSIFEINISVLGAERFQLRKRVTCALCPRQQDHKTTEMSPFCDLPMCNDHRLYLCVDCASQTSISYFHIF